MSAKTFVLTVVVIMVSLFAYVLWATMPALENARIGQ